MSAEPRLNDRARKILLGIILFLGIAGAGAWFYVRNAARVTPRGQPPLQSLSPEDWTSFRQAFNDADDRTRVVVLLSPT